MASEAYERHIDRKTFIKEAPKMFLRAFAQGAQRTREDSGGREAPPILRPPGAGGDFLELCCGGGACADACPAEAIRLLPRGDDPSRAAPAIVPVEAPCVVCEELSCMKVCVSGALTPVPREEVRIGLARVDTATCLSWSGIDPGCDYCADRCPIGPEAIRMEKSADGRGPTVKKGCVGCGMCEFFCPARPSAIRIFAPVTLCSD